MEGMHSKQGITRELWSSIENTEVVGPVTEGSRLVFWYVLVLLRCLAVFCEHDCCVPRSLLT